MTANEKARKAQDMWRRFLELWVLWAIDELDPEDARGLAAMEPELRKAWSVCGTWHEMLAQIMGLRPP
jgi:hypothetical protein